MLHKRFHTLNVLRFVMPSTGLPLFSNLTLATIFRMNSTFAKSMSLFIIHYVVPQNWITSAYHTEKKSEIQQKMWIPSQKN